MSNELKEFLEDWRAHWNDSYWWADHQALQVIILGILAGAISLTFVWLECVVKVNMLEGLGDGLGG